MAAFAITAASYAQWSNPADDVPAYHPSAPLKLSALPPILADAKLTCENFRYPWQIHVYQQAAQIGNVIYQLPCYCRCDRALGHTSLRSCFEGLHGTECSTCAKEVFFAYRQTKVGKTPAEIRAAIGRQEYERIVCFRQSSVIEESGLFLSGWNGEDAAHGGAADIEAAGDLGFAKARAA